MSKDVPDTERNQHEKLHIEGITSADLLTKQNCATMDPKNFQDSFMLLCPVRGDMKSKSGPRKRPIDFTTASSIVEGTSPKMEWHTKLATASKPAESSFQSITESREENQQDQHSAEGSQLFNDAVGDVFVKKSEFNGTPIYVCPKCHKEFTRYSVFRLHHHSHQSEELNSSSFSCKTCKKKFTTSAILEKHSKLHFQGIFKVEHIESQTLSDQKKKLKRKKCNQRKNYNQRKAKEFIKLFQPPSESSISNQLHEKPSQESLSSKMGLQDLQSHVSREPEFTAEVLQSARQYIKAVSKRRKEYTMKRIMSSQPECVRKKHSVTGLGVDVELQPSEQSLPIVSQNNGRYSYSCKVCGKSFFNKFHHREHFNVHSGEMPYECEFCTKRFAQRSGWNRHIKLHHKYDVFQGPIPYSSTKKLFGNLVNKKETKVSNAQPPTSSSIAPVPSTSNGVKRYIPIAPYPTNSIPLSSVILTPDQFPADQFPSSGLVIQQPSTLANINQIPSVNLIATSNTGTASVIPNKIAPKELQVVFQCKKVRSMDGRLIFMVRIAPQCMYKIDELERKLDFAYILDSCGNVESRIFVSDHPGDDWVDFPLDPLANEILIERLNSYCDKNRRGPKNKVSSFTSTKGNSASSSEKASLDEAFTQFRQRYDFFTSEDNISEVPKNITSSIPLNPIVTIISNSSHSVPIINASASTQLTQKNAIEGDQNQLQPVPKETYGRKFTSGKEKRFSCSLCGRKFLAQAHLNDHMKIHTGELPFKCMFCGRPFRHKSGLNSHHKRHIQNGIFDRPISSFKIKEPVVNDTDLSSTHENTQERITMVEKPKRKQSNPKHVERHIETEAINDLNDNEDIILHIKEEIEDDDDITNNFQYNENVKIESNSPDTNEMFDCNFCGLSFPLRTTYLKHVRTAHKAANNLTVSHTNDSSEGLIDVEMDTNLEISDINSDFPLNGDVHMKSSFINNTDLETSDQSSNKNMFLTEIKIT